MSEGGRKAGIILWLVVGAHILLLHEMPDGHGARVAVVTPRPVARRLMFALGAILLAAPVSWLAEASSATLHGKGTAYEEEHRMNHKAFDLASARPRQLEFLMTHAGRRIMNATDEVPLSEYPRPQLQRDGQWLVLNGWWEWQEIRGWVELGTALAFRARVPFPVEAPLSGLALGSAAPARMRYRRHFRVPESWGWPLRCSVRLHLGAVDWRSVVAVNSKRVTTHSGGFTPFSADIDQALRDGLPQNKGWHTIEVDVYDPTDTRRQGQPVGKQRTLSGGIFYTAATGIWGTVWIEQIPLVATIQSLRLVYLPPAQIHARVTVDPTHGARTVASDFKINAELFAPKPDAEGPGNPAGWWRAQVRSNSIATVDGIGCVASKERVSERTDFRQDVGLSDTHEMITRVRCNATLTLRSPPQLWSPEAPNLHGVVVRLHGPGGVLIDTVRSYIGLRTVALQRSGSGHARLILNGKPRFSAGVLDQGYWPDGVYTAPSDEALSSDITAAKRLGFDLVRKHAKVESARWYYHADRLGVLVWQDMPSPPAITCKSNADGDPEWKKKKKKQTSKTQSRETNTLKPPSPPSPPLPPSPPSLPPPSLTPGEPEEREDDGITADHDGPERRVCPLDKSAYAQELHEMVSWLSFSPSIMLWVVFNEGWGQHDTASAVRTVRRLDPSRLVTDASGWLLGSDASVHAASATPSGNNDHGKKPWLQTALSQAASGCASESNGDCGDLIDVHAYPGPVPSRVLRKRWYGGGEWERLRWLSSPDRASVVGEFGGARFEMRGHTFGTKGWGYGKETDRTCLQFADELAALWHRVANTTGLSAAVYTQLTDVEMEWNGLLTYDRVPKCEALLAQKVLPAIQRARQLLS